MLFTDYDSFGRFDQYMYLFYLCSKEQGMDEEQALLYLKYLLIKIEESDAILNMTIGGILPGGGTGINELTYLVMQAVRDMGFKSPNLSLRIGKSTPQKLWDEVHVSLSKGQGLPALYNEDLIVPMLESLDIPAYDAENFALAGCSQVVIPGKSNFSCDVGVYNMLKCLELALHDGFDPGLGIQVGPHTGKSEMLDDFSKVMNAYSLMAIKKVVLKKKPPVSPKNTAGKILAKKL